MAMHVQSPAFADGAPIPRKFTRDGQNHSPPIEWSGVPAGTRSLVVVMDDPDAPGGTFRHWAIYNLAATDTSLPEAAATGSLGEGINDFGRSGYDGPQPPKGHGPHHYHIRVAALDVDRLAVRPSAKAEEIWEAAKPHMLDQAETVGTYSRV